MKFRLPNHRTGAVLGAAAILAVATGGGAVAGSVVTGAQIKNGTIETVDLSPDAVNSRRVDDGSLRMRDFREGVQDRINAGGPQGPKGETGPAGPAGSAKYVGANWGIIDRNVEGNGDAFLRSGPTVGAIETPSGIGSLGLRTGSSTDKVAFGNQVDFVGDLVSGLSTLKYSVFTTGENKAKYAENLPSLAFEINPHTTRTYSTLVYTPVEAPASTWTEQDASTAKRWWLTGSTGTDTSCNQATYCTLAEVQAKLPDATILTVQITKGKDYAFSGAVDKLVINDTTYDFEPYGVSSN